MRLFSLFYQTKNPRGWIFMRNIEVLEMINAGRIEELKAKLQDEIYADTLKVCPRR